MQMELVMPMMSWANENASPIFSRSSFLCRWSMIAENWDFNRDGMVLSLICRAGCDLSIFLIHIDPTTEPHMFRIFRILSHSPSSCCSCHRVLNPLSLLLGLNTNRAEKAPWSTARIWASKSVRLTAPRGSPGPSLSWYTRYSAQSSASTPAIITISVQSLLHDGLYPAELMDDAAVVVQDDNEEAQVLQQYTKAHKTFVKKSHLILKEFPPHL